MSRQKVVLEDYIVQVQAGDDKEQVAQDLLDQLLVEMGVYKTTDPEAGDSHGNS